MGLFWIMKTKVNFLICIFSISSLFLMSACNKTLILEPCTKKNLTGKIWEMYDYHEPQVSQFGQRAGIAIRKKEDSLFIFGNQYRLFYEDNSARHITSNKPFDTESLNIYLKAPASLVYKINNQGEVSVSADYGNAPPYKFLCIYHKEGSEEMIELKFNDSSGKLALMQNFVLKGASSRKRLKQDFIRLIQIKD
jgi:hypothetical protein